MNKKILCSIFTLIFTSFCSVFIFAQVNGEDKALQDAVAALKEEAEEEEKANAYEYPKKDKIYPDAKRPKSADPEKLKAALEKNIDHATDEYVKQTEDTFKFGLEGSISDILTEITDNCDPRFAESAYDLFQKTKSNSIRAKILNYFAALEDPCLEDFAVEIVNDPFGKKSYITEACFNYVSKVKSKDSIPALIEIIEKEEEEFFLRALTALGEVGGSEEARFLASYIKRADLTVPQKQTLVRVLGKLKAVETYDTLASLAQDENENSHVRMYAAEAIGAMEKSEAEEVLIDLFEDEDPNLRASVIKGLSNYNSGEAVEVIEQALRDAHYKVRLEAIAAVEKQNLTSSAPYIVYRCKDTKEEKVVREKALKVLSKLNCSEGNEYLLGVIKDSKASDTNKAQVAAALLENGNGTSEVLALAKEALNDPKRQKLRYALGKEFAKYGRAEFADICAEYIASKDVPTQGTGLDIYAKGRYSSVTAAVQELAQPAIDEEAEKKAAEESKNNDEQSANQQTSKKKTRVVNQNSRKAKKILEYIGG